MKKIVIINFTGLRGNWGCQATSFELLRFVASLYPDDEKLDLHTVPLLGTGRVDSEGDARIDEVYDSFEAVAEGERGPALALLTDLAERRYARWADTVKTADLVVFQAEGSMGMGDDFAKGPRLMLLPFVAKHAWGRTVIALNQTFYSQNPKVRRNAVVTFGSLDFFAFRESASVALAKSCGLERACLVPDLAFMARAWDSDAAIDDPSCFAVTGSALKDPRRYDCIIDQTRRIAKATGLRPLIAVSRDYQLTLASYRALSGLGAERLPRRNTYADVTARLASAAFLLGGRYHMSIMAAAGGTPNILLTGNSFKNEGLAHLIDSPRPVRGFADTDGVVADAEAILANLPAERAAVRARVAELRGIIGRARDHVRALVDGRQPGAFRDGFAEMQIDGDEMLRRYRKYGSGKRKPRGRAKLWLHDQGERLIRPNQTPAIRSVISDCVRGGDTGFSDVLGRLV